MWLLAAPWLLPKRTVGAHRYAVGRPDRAMLAEER